MIAFDVSELQVNGSRRTQAGEFLLRAIAAASKGREPASALLYCQRYPFPDLPEELCRLRVLPADRGYIKDLEFEWLITASPFHVLSTDLIALVRDCCAGVKVATFVSDLARATAGVDSGLASAVFHLGIGVIADSDMILTSGGVCADALRARVGSKRSIVDIGYGVADQLYRDLPANMPAWRQIQRRVPKLRSGRYIFTIFPDQRDAGLLCLLEGYATLPNAVRAQYTLLIAGGLSLPLRRQYEEQWNAIRGRAVARDGEIIFLPNVSAEEIQALYRGCRAFVYAREEERFPLSLAEAIVSRCAFATCQGATISAIDPPVEALFELSSPAQISEKLLLACTDEGFRSRCSNWDSRARDSLRWQNVEAAFVKAISTGAPTRTVPPHRAGPAIGVAGTLSPHGAELREYDVEVHSQLVRGGGVRWYAPDDAPRSPGVLPISSLRRDAHHFDKLLYILSDGPTDTEILAYLQERPGIVWLHDVALKRLAFHQATMASATPAEPWARLNALVEKYTFDRSTDIRSWQAFQGLPYGFLRPLIPNAAEIIVHSHYEKALVTSDLGGASASRAIHVLPHAIPTSPETEREAREIESAFINIGVMCDPEFMKLAIEALRIFGSSRKNVTVYIIESIHKRMESVSFVGVRRQLELSGIKVQYFSSWIGRGYLSVLLRLDLVLQLADIATGDDVKRVARAIGSGIAIVSNSKAIREMWGPMTLHVETGASALGVAGLLERAIERSYQQELHDVRASELPRYSPQEIGRSLRRLLSGREDWG